MSEEEKIEESHDDGKAESLKEIHDNESVNDNSSTANKEPQTTNYQPQTQAMEVHHHPDLHHKKKNFREYFLEFLMIFLAVTMGFFAESLREHINDSGKENEYIVSLISDLQQDTIGLKSSISDNKLKLSMLDSLIDLSFKNIDDPITRQKLYKTFDYVGAITAFGSNDATMMQLKNAGGLQLIKQPHAADSIANYDGEMKGIYAAEVPYLKTSTDAIDIAQGILDFTCLKDTTYYKNGNFTNKPLPLLDNDPKKIKIFFNKIANERGWTKNYIDNLQERVPYAERLIAFLKKEYHLDNE